MRSDGQKEERHLGSQPTASTRPREMKLLREYVNGFELPRLKEANIRDVVDERRSLGHLCHLEYWMKRKRDEESAVQRHGHKTKREKEVIER